MSVRGLRNALASLVPSWLSNRVGKNVGYRVLYAVAAEGDMLLEYARQGVRAWMPGLSLSDNLDLDPTTALPYMGASRGLVQGFTESAASFANRCRLWLDLWPFAGRPGGVLSALLGYVLPVSPLVRQVDNSSNWYTFAPGTNVFTQPIPLPAPALGASNWQWDSLGPPFGYSVRWWRVWYLLFNDGNVGYNIFGIPACKWGGIAWGDGSCWGWGPPLGQSGSGTAGSYAQLAQTMLSLVRTWKRARIVAELLVVHDHTYFDPSLAFGSSQLPDGHWGTWGKLVADATYGTVYKPARPPATVVSFLGQVI